MTNTAFDLTFTAFLILLQAKVDAYNNEPVRPGSAPNICGTKFVTEVGQKRTRVVAVRTFNGEISDQRSAYYFVDHQTGDILKPDGWKRPANGARGNIFSPNPVEHCGPHGVAYLG